MRVFGIDLGTTNSLIAYWEEGEVTLVPNKHGSFLTPSVVGEDDKGRIVVGEVARERLKTKPELTTSLFKRNMGTNKVTTLRKRKYRSEELSSLVIQSLLADVKEYCGEVVKAAVVSVPAYFSDAQRQATKNAAKLAGIEVTRLINEPTAAAIAYGIHEKSESNFLVFDIGGGTFDVSIMEMFEGIMQVSSTAGDNRLGGEDFVGALIKNFREKNNLVAKYISPKDISILRENLESLKVKLSTQDKAEFEVSLNKLDYSYSCRREEFEQICAPLLSRLRKPLERAVNDSGLRLSELDTVILVGGASRMPVIRSLVSKMLGVLPTSHLNPDQIVAVGSAIHAAMVNRVEELEERVLTDVTPFTLGVAVVDENFSRPEHLVILPIIERNSPVPISREETVWNASDQQTHLKVMVYQGESRKAESNVFLGEINVPIPLSKQNQESVRIRFTYDISGILEVDVSVASTGYHKTAVLQHDRGSMTPEEISKALKKLQSLKVHPRENLENQLLIERGEYLYETHLGDVRDLVRTLLSKFEHLIEGQEASEIEEFRVELTRIFDEIENNSTV